MVTAKGTELALVEPGQYAILQADPREVAEVLREALGTNQITARDFQTYKVPSQGMTIWSTVDTLTGEAINAPEIHGVLIHNTMVRGFWQEQFSGGGVPPDCNSKDGLLGEGLYGVGSERHPTGACQTCPMAQYGSAKALWPPTDKQKPTEAQACKANRLLFLLTADGFLPVVIKVPPASLKEVKTFLLAMANKGMAPSSAVLRFTLEKDKNANALAYSKIVPRFGQRLAPAEADQVRGIAAQLRAAIDGVTEASWTFLADDDEAA